MRIVGLTGTVWAGKGTVVDYMVEHMWYTHFSVRGFLEKQLDARGLPHDRDQMRDLANEYRKNFGADYIVKKLYDEAREHGTDAVIESIRCIGEIEALRQYSDFVLIGVDADIYTRYERVFKRGASTDDVSFDTFVEQEQKEMHGGNPFVQNLAGCLLLADERINNDGTPVELYREVERVLA